MLKLRKFLLVALCALMIFGTLCGCGEKYKDSIIYFELLDKPQTLDPQMASSDSELLIVRNIYEGLLREDKDGNIELGVCEDYSYENLTYTFNIKKDAVWSNGDKVTAYDFEYAFRRAVDPKINAPFVSRLFAIENAEAIYTGNADLSALGVNALNDTTLTITMCKEDDSFLKTLTTSICMPCNEAFFEESIGKYGLDAKCIISNGSYRLTKWNKEEFGIRIYKNEQYCGRCTAQNAAVFISCIDDETQTSRLSGGESDIAFLGSEELEAAKNAGLATKNVQNICWIMTIGRNYNDEVRRAFATSFNADVYKNALPVGFDVAKSVFPDILGINTDNIGMTEYNLDEAKQIMSDQIYKMEDKKFPPSTLYYYNASGVKALATAIVGHWQQNLSTFINIEPSENLEALQNELKDNSTLEFALFPIVAKSNYFNEYAKMFISRSNAQAPDTLQQEALADHTILPVAYQSTNISYISTLENVVVCEDNGYVDFSHIIKR